MSDQHLPEMALPDRPDMEKYFKSKLNRRMILIGGAIVSGLLVILGMYFFLQPQTRIPLDGSQITRSEFTAPEFGVANVAEELEILPTPTPDPFQELTIPYLRNRQYQSQLGEREQISSNSNYTSYVASYDSDGLKVNGLLTIPQGEQPADGWPAIVFIHGYIAPTVYRTRENYASYVDYFARNGFVVFKIDLRGHDQSEGEAGGAYYSGDYIIDTLNAYSALQNSEFVNPQGIGLWGHSMAGNVSFRSFVAKQDIPAIVIWAGAVYTYEDMQEFGIDDNSYRPPSVTSQRRRDRELLRQTHGEFAADDEFWQQVVPVNYLDGVIGAVEIHHAVDDSVVNIGYSRGLIEVLDGTNIEHQLYEYPSGGHNLTGSSFNQAMQRSVEFFQEKLR